MIPLRRSGGLVPMVLIKLGEVIYGGVGCGIYGVMVFVIIAVFMAGLMVGRTPEYMGKKIEAYEVKMASVAALVPAFFILFCTAVSRARQARTGRPGQSGAAWSLRGALCLRLGWRQQRQRLCGTNRLHAFLGHADGLDHLCRAFLGDHSRAGDRGIAGAKESPSRQPRNAAHAHAAVCGFPGVHVVIVGALTFFPAWSLGPVVEHLMMIGA